MEQAVDDKGVKVGVEVQILGGLGRPESSQEVSERCNWLRFDEALR